MVKIMIYKIMIFSGKTMVSFLKVKKKLIKTLHYFEYLTFLLEYLTFCVSHYMFVFLTDFVWAFLFVCFLFNFELIFFNDTRNMRHCRKFHFVGIYLFKFILHLKFEKTQDLFSISSVGLV